MSTNIFQLEVGQFLKAHFSIAERLDDSAANRFGGYQVSKKPYDFFGATKTGLFWGAEAKMVKQPRFPTGNLDTHQRTALSQLEDNNCLAFVFINWRFPKTGEAIWITFGDYCEIEYLVLAQRKSLIPNHFDENWFLTRKTGGWGVPKTHNLYKLL